MKMAQNRLSGQDRKDLDKYTKYFAFKAVQVIVQSRLGEKIKTKSKPHSSGSDWFNLSIRDIPEVLAEAKKSMAGQIPMVGLGMCVEISLKTVEGDTMVLETWYLEMLEQCDYTARVTCTVYSRMSILLKSLIAVTRVTPAYKVASLQGPDSFVICYRVYMGEPQGNCLGDGYLSFKVGQVGTPIGTLILTVAYRTQLTITPQKVQSKDCQFMVKSDHFKPDMSPKHARCPSHNAFHIDHRSVEDELAAACQECQDNHPATNPPQNHGHDRKPLSKNAKDNSISPTCASNQEESILEARIVAPFAEEWRKTDQELSEYFIPEVPYGFLQPPPTGDTANLNGNLSKSSTASNNNNDDAPVPTTENEDSRNGVSDAVFQHTSAVTSYVDDFVMIELKPAFARRGDGPLSDLRIFLEECQTAPPLASFSDMPSFADQVGDLTSQLNSMPDFDDFVKSLCQDDDTGK